MQITLSGPGDEETQKLVAEKKKNFWVLGLRKKIEREN